MGVREKILTRGIEERDDYRCKTFACVCASLVFVVFCWWVFGGVFTQTYTKKRFSSGMCGEMRQVTKWPGIVPATYDRCQCVKVLKFSF